MAYETVEPTLIPNTVMQKYINNSGVFRGYNISPAEGYCLHDKARDTDYIPDTGEPADGIILGYTTATTSVGSDYNFNKTSTIDGYTAYGSFELFARPLKEIT